MSKLDEVKNNCLTGKTFGQEWCSISKEEFHWMVETIERQDKEIVNLKKLQQSIKSIEQLQREFESLKYEIKKSHPHDPYGYEAY